MKTTLSYIAYFEALAAKAKFIDAYFYGHDELKENGDSAEGTVFVLEPYTNQISENQNDNTLSTREGMFVILKPYDSDIGREYASVQDACEKLCYKVIGQLKRDSRAGLIEFPISNWRGNPAEPLIGNWIGYMIEFSFEAPINTFMVFDQDDWN